MRKLIIAIVVCAGAVCGCSGSRVATLEDWWSPADFDSRTAFSDLGAAMDKFDAWCELVSAADSCTALRAVVALSDSSKTDPVAYNIYSEWLRDALHNPASPHRSDFLFRAWLDRTLEDALLDEWLLDELRRISSVADNFRCGHPAADFTVQDASGNAVSLSDFAGTPVALLFLDAGCQSCSEYVAEIEKELVSRGLDAVRLAVFSGSSPAHLAFLSLPSGWIAAWSPSRELENWRIFDLTLLPSAILVSPDGTVEEYMLI